jgi:A/G-specific adenine glycosylase
MTKKEKEFTEIVWSYYREHGRHDLLWRNTSDPYKILVSELMLQQTQVERVIPKYEVFLKAFPTVRRLAAAPLGDVLRLWQGLGYNRRAKYVHETAKVVTGEWKGKFPRTKKELESLPGVGSYTAGAIMAFAYNEPVILIETNVRQVYIHHFYKLKTDIRDSDILELIEKTVSEDNPREWYWALMDYGAFLKRQHGNLVRQSKHYVKQSQFQGSDRQIRGAIITVLTTSTKPLTQKLVETRLVEVRPRLEVEGGRVSEQPARPPAEGMVQKTGQRYCLS